MSPHQQRSILIVEDERIVAKDIQLTLRELGYDAYAIASSADQAIARASERCPDLVLMDIRIQGERDGVATAGILRTRFNVPIVYLTSHADEDTVGRAARTEPQGYLVKPVKAGELRSVVEIALYKHEMEKRLRERERWFSTTLRSIADAVIAVDLAGNVAFMNSAAEALTGVGFASASGKPVDEVLRVVDRVTAADPTPQAVRGGGPVEFREGDLLNLSNGLRRAITESAAPVVDEDRDTTLGKVIVFRDVTERKKLQEQLERSDRLASLGTMAAGVAHEVNNPLAVVSGNAEFLSSELALLQSQYQVVSGPGNPRFEDMAHALADLRSATERIRAIVADLHAFSRPAPAITGAVDVNVCIEWAVRTTSRELRHRARLVVNVTGTLFVQADETRLGQVLVNLLLNAAQSIAPGDAERHEVSIAAHGEPSGGVMIEVRDTGQGIAPEHLKRIFEPFFTTKDVGQGTGLGLSICHGIVRSLGGEIQVESQVGLGTLVRVSLPAARAASAAPTPASETPAPNLRGRILIVDDEEMVRTAVERILQDHQTVCVGSAKAALELLEQGQSFDCILCDVIMPVMTGVAFYEALLGTKPELARRVVFVTGGAITEQIDDFLRAVPNPRIDKPFDIGDLRATIQRLLHAREALPRTDSS